MYFACRGPASTSSTSTIVSVLVIFGHGSSRRRLRTFLPLHLTIVRVSIFFFRFVPASMDFRLLLFLQESSWIRIPQTKLAVKSYLTVFFTHFWVLRNFDT